MKKTYDELFLNIVLLGEIKDVLFGSQENGDNFADDDFIID